MENNRSAVCIDTANGGEFCQLQLWVEGAEGSFHFVVRNQFQPQGRIVRRCALETGPSIADFETAEAAGRAALARLAEPEATAA